MSVHLFLNPLDVWLFRDGKPFNAGSDHRAETIFPPLPTVIQGAIRTHYIEQHGGIPAYLAGKLAEVEAVVGKPGATPPETFRISGPFVATWTENQLTRYFPLPNHAYKHNEETYRLLKPDSRSDVQTNLDSSVDLLWQHEGATPAKREESEGDLWLDEEALLKLLTRKELDRFQITKGSKLFKKEIRLGIDRNDETLGSEEGAIYQAEFVRLVENRDGQVGLYVAVEGLPDWPEQGTLMLGGEGHAAAYRQIAAPKALSSPSINSNGFTVTFLTPTYFKSGWQAANWDHFFDTTVQLKAAAVSRPVILGGFDVAKKEHKPARRYVPAGSTYYFKGKPLLKDKVICDNPADGRIGFGQFILGEW